MVQRCPRCGDTPFALVQASGAGSSHSAYMIDEAGARRRAALDAYAALLEEAITARGLVPCPSCGARDPRMPARLRRTLALKAASAVVIFAGIGAPGVYVGYPWFGGVFLGIGLLFAVALGVEHLLRQRRLRARLTFVPPPPELRTTEPVMEDPEDGLAVYLGWDVPTPASAAAPPPPSEPTAPPRPAGRQKRPPTLPTARQKALPFLMLAGAVTGAVLLGWGADVWLEGHQTIHVINPCVSSADVRIGDATLALAPGAMVTVTRPEGRHHVQVSLQNGHSYETDITLENSVGQRLGRSTAFIFNVLGAEPLLWEEIVYVDERVHRKNPRPRARILMGVDFHAIRDVEYLFTEPPDEVELHGGAQQAIRTMLSRIQEDPIDVIDVATEQGLLNPNQALPYLEGHILGGDRRPELATRYLAVCGDARQDARCQAFLQKAGLTQEP
ncbi:MAG: hypothetical protein KC933_02720 [Myxococcales bacterium]|nr:hypothetical protein [Myxococcales bacterium]